MHKTALFYTEMSKSSVGNYGLMEVNGRKTKLDIRNINSYDK